jgi:hypothetical protein
VFREKTLKSPQIDMIIKTAKVGKNTPERGGVEMKKRMRTNYLFAFVSSKIHPLLT